MTLLTWIYVNMMEVIAAWVPSIYYVITFRVHKKPIFAYFYPFTHLLARDVLVMKKLEIKKTKSTFIISVLKVVYWVVLVFSISHFFINKREGN